MSRFIRMIIHFLTVSPISIRDGQRKTDTVNLCTTGTAVLRHNDFCVMLKNRITESYRIMERLGM